jgi:hypothetical protein
MARSAIFWARKVRKTASESGTRAVGSFLRIAQNRTRVGFILNVILHVGMTFFFQSFLDSYAGVAQSNHTHTFHYIYNYTV